MTCPSGQRTQLRVVVRLRAAEPQQSRSRRAQTLEFPGWVVHPAPVMSSHAVTLAGRAEGHPFPGLWARSAPGKRLGSWRCVCWLGVGARWGESAFLVNSYFQIEFEPGHGDFRLKLVLEAKPSLAGETRSSSQVLFIFCLSPFNKTCVCGCVGVLVRGALRPLLRGWVSSLSVICQRGFQFRCFSLLSGCPSLLALAGEIFVEVLKQE